MATHAAGEKNDVKVHPVPVVRAVGGKGGYMGNKEDFHQPEGISITVITDNYYDALRPDHPC